MTTTGVIAAANTVPGRQSSGITIAAAALAAAAIRSVLTERPPCVGLSLLTPLHASESTCEPGTMSSEPSSQRTQALWPPS